MLNWIWAGFFFVAFVAGRFRWLVLGETGVWAAMVGSSFDMAKTGFEVSLGLTGVMCLWLGIMRVGEKGGAVALPARAFARSAHVLFLVVNPSAVTVIPTAIMTYRAQLGAADPTDVFLPLLIATFCSTMVGILVTARVQKLPLGNPVTLG